MGSTVVNAYPYPETYDPRDVPSHLRDLADAAALGSVQRFTNATERAAAYNRLGISPTDGMTSYLKDIRRTEVYRSAAWVPAGAVPLRRGRRTSNSSATATEVGVLRLDDIQLTTGRLYAVEVCNIIFSSTVAADIIACNIRYTTDGSTPSVASSNMGFVRNPGATFGPSLSLLRYYPAEANDLLSVLLTVSRTSGSGNVSISANGTVNPLDLVVWDCGEDPGNTGVDI